MLPSLSLLESGHFVHLAEIPLKYFMQKSSATWVAYYIIRRKYLKRPQNTQNKSVWRDMNEGVTVREGFS